MGEKAAVGSGRQGGSSAAEAAALGEDRQNWYRLGSAGPQAPSGGQTRKNKAWVKMQLVGSLFCLGLSFRKNAVGMSLPSCHSIRN